MTDAEIVVGDRPGALVGSAGGPLASIAAQEYGRCVTDCARDGDRGL
jgi:hypothetical protein